MMSTARLTCMREAKRERRTVVSPRRSVGAAFTGWREVRALDARDEVRDHA
jgi:hypothetical protein